VTRRRTRCRHQGIGKVGWGVPSSSVHSAQNFPKVSNDDDGPDGMLHKIVVILIVFSLSFRARLFESVGAKMPMIVPCPSGTADWQSQTMDAPLRINMSCNFHSGNKKEYLSCISALRVTGR
jgi:hypothetical protein